ncbi:TetR/AcrR family transcriptional regulator [Microbacterium hominis]|uniref:TetR/AcrR family transcriptional regulator n=1 Tax=Microbacterium hominis TaxID=162426 RepID=UPI001C275ECF|nr:TetR/AcrR family transcriptional regulator [Microbacterium hominis]
MAATIAELREVGYAAMTMDAVARRAGAGKVSVYRRWRTKAELAREAAYRLVGEPELPPEPSTLREDLLAAFRAMAQQMEGPAGEALRGIVSEALRDAAAPSVFDGSRAGSLRAMRTLVARAAARGEPVDPAPAPTRLQAAPALIQHRFLTQGVDHLDEAFLVEVIDEVALPLLRRDG